MRSGQIDLHGRAVIRLAVDLEVTARLLDEAVDHRQAEAGALPLGFCRVERLDRAGDLRAVMPVPVSEIAIRTYWPGTRLGVAGT